jgi:hypothetical protein
MDVDFRFGETQLDEGQRVTTSVWRRRGYSAIAASRLFSLMTADELRELRASGIDIQRCIPPPSARDEAQVQREISDNRAFMEPVAASDLTHFCYPSDLVGAPVAPLAALRGDDLRSRTELRGAARFASAVFDGSISQIEFEMSGFSDPPAAPLASRAWAHAASSDAVPHTNGLSFR